jgi:hypothetical protein
MSHPTPQELRALQPALYRKLRRLNAQAWGISVGLVAGLLLFTATNVLILRGGAVVGPHLSLLSIVLPGYRVTFAGSLIGFVYLFVLGYGLGRLIGGVYNRIVDR